MKKGRIVILLAGRLAGKKAIIIKQNDEGKKVSRYILLEDSPDPTLSFA